jgi:hypothetical protein
MDEVHFWLYDVNSRLIIDSETSVIDVWIIFLYDPIWDIL